MTRTQSYIIVGLAMSVVVVCALVIMLVWIRFSPNIPSTSVVIIPTDIPLLTLTPLPTDTPVPTATATRVVVSSLTLTDAEQQYLDDLEFYYGILYGALLEINNLTDKVQLTPELLYDEEWQTDLLVAAVIIYGTGETIKTELSPPESLYEFHQDILIMTDHLINAGRALEIFVDTDNSQFLETATGELLAIAPVQDRILEQLDVLDLQGTVIPTSTSTHVIQVTPVTQVSTPATPTPTKQKCRMRMGSTYILVDCDQVN